MNRRHFLRAAAGTAALPVLGCSDDGPSLLNASYDATRELYRRLNRLFTAQHKVKVRASHGGSGSQARAVIDGLPADVLTLALWPDTDAVHKAGLIDASWEDRFPHHSCPYTSTIVFVVRKGNPHGIRDWDDLRSKPNLKVIAANPKTSGAAKLALLALWGSVVTRGGSDREAEALVKAVYRRVPALESSSRAATVTFARKQIGDVHLTWENEAHLEVRELKGELEIVHPRRSILAEPHVAVVDANTRRHGTAALAEAYLRSLYEPDAQDVIAEEYYRPTTPEAAKKHAGRFGEINLFRIEQVTPGGWPEAQAKFFAAGGVFDRVYAGG
ncbi:MAG TPA: sulfate ABC transporter substrate-binding protein [Fimbriiglobus sp.]|nr:sulfate ABC transporter substrate-binding protein [Fimbriiglobus sp.]